MSERSWRTPHTRSDLRHGVGDPEEHARVGPRHLGVGEVEAPGDGELVQRHPRRDEDHVARPLLARQQLHAEEGEGGGEEADTVEQLPQRGDAQFAGGAQAVKQLPRGGEQQHAEGWKHGQHSVLIMVNSDK